MGNILSAADWSQVPTSVGASKHFRLRTLGEFGLGGMPTAPHPANRESDI